VSNAQPVWWRTLTRGQWLVLVGASLAWAFDCFDQQIFNLARDGAIEHLIPNAKLATEYGPYTTSVFLIAWAIGGLVFGALGDRHGRARMLAICILLYSMSTGLGTLSTGILDFCLYRFMSGLGVGVYSASRSLSWPILYPMALVRPPSDCCSRYRPGGTLRQD
jgi:MFS family permease